MLREGFHRIRGNDLMALSFIRRSFPVGLGLFLVGALGLSGLPPTQQERAAHAGVAHAGQEAAQSWYFLPYPARGQGWQTIVMLTNLGSRELRVNFAAYDEDGEFLGASTIRLAAQATRTLETGEVLPESGTLKVEAKEHLWVGAIFRTRDGTKAEVLPALDDPSRQLDFPALLPGDLSGKTITLLNPDAASASLELIALDQNGAELSRTLLPSLPPMASHTFAVQDLFSGDILQQLSTVRVISDRGIVGLQLVDPPDGDLVGLPALTITSREWSFPIATQSEGGELWTAVGLFNPGEVATSVTIEAFDAAHHSLGLIDSLTLLPGAVHFVLTANQHGRIPEEAAFLKVTADQAISGYQVVGVVNGKGLSAALGILGEDPTVAGLEMKASTNGSVLSVYPRVRMGDGSIKSIAGSLGSGEWKIVPNVALLEVEKMKLPQASVATKSIAAAQATYKISGNITLQIPGGNYKWNMNNVTVNLNGVSSNGEPVSRTSRTGSDGNYSFSGLSPGKYRITPTKPGYTFSPEYLDVTISRRNEKAKTFVANKNTSSESSQQPQLKAPWREKAFISQGNNSGITHNTCGKRSRDPNNCVWENTYALDISKGKLVRFDVVAPVRGEIVGYLDQFNYPGRKTGPGKLLFLKVTGPNGREYILVFAHLWEIYKKQGPVEKGEVIAQAGVICDETPQVCGYSNSGYHLHFHISDDSIITRKNEDGTIQTGPELHTIPIGQLWMRRDGEASFKNYESKGNGDDDSTKGSLDDSAVARKYFWSDQAGTSSQWAKTYGAWTEDVSWSIQQTSDGGYIVAGNTKYFGAGGSDIWVLKLDQNGNIQWQKTYGGPDWDIASSIQQTSDGGYIVAGDTRSFGAGGWDIWVLKLDQNGNIQWQKTYGGRSDDSASSIQQTSDGGYIVAGDTRSFGAGDLDIWVLKLDQNGNIQWQKTYGGPMDDYNSSPSIQQTSDGGYIVAGDTKSFGAGRWDIWVLKLDQNGNIQWQKTYGGRSDDSASSIQQTSDGGYIVAGDTRSFGAGESEIWVLKLDQNGNIQWQKTYGGRSDDFAPFIQQTSDGGYIVAGDTMSFGAGDLDIWVLKLDQNGNIQWQKTYGGRNGDFASSIQQTSDGGYIVAGYTTSFGAGGIWVLKLDANGDIGGCNLIGTSNATVKDTSVNGVATSVTPRDTSVSGQNSSAVIKSPTLSSSQQCGAP
jgi:hypothetical protein